jgi:hypothetical protein
LDARVVLARNVRPTKPFNSMVIGWAIRVDRKAVPALRFLA